MTPKIPESHSNLGLYLGALIILVLAAFCAILTIAWMRPEKDNTTLIAVVVGLIIPIINGIVNTITSQKTQNKAEETHKEIMETKLMVNGRLQALLEETKKAAYAEGEAVARKEMGLLLVAPPVIALDKTVISTPKDVS